MYSRRGKSASHTLTQIHHILKQRTCVPTCYFVCSLYMFRSRGQTQHEISFNHHSEYDSCVLFYVALEGSEKVIKEPYCFWTFLLINVSICCLNFDHIWTTTYALQNINHMITAHVQLVKSYANWLGKMEKSMIDKEIPPCVKARVQWLAESFFY